MDKSHVNIDVNTIGMAVKVYARFRALQAGSYIIYKENGDIIREDPRTGKKIITKAAQKNKSCLRYLYLVALMEQAKRRGIVLA